MVWPGSLVWPCGCLSHENQAEMRVSGPTGARGRGMVGAHGQAGSVSTPRWESWSQGSVDQGSPGIGG